MQGLLSVDFFRRLDRGWARVEGGLSIAILIAMVLVTGLTAVVRNLHRMGIAGAAELLSNTYWTDPFLRNATLSLAFLGASQATYYHKHIRIDLVPQRLPLRARYVVHAIVGVGSGLAMFALAYSLAAVVNITLHELPLDYGVVSDGETKHVCDATASELQTIDSMEVPHGFCIVRKGFAALGISVQGPTMMFRIVLPILFAVIGMRLLGTGVGAALAVASGPEALLQLEAAAQARLVAARAELAGEALESSDAAQSDVRSSERERPS